MPLKVSDGMGAWIDDFKKSDAPQFKGKSDKERRDQAIAAYLSAKRGDKQENVKSADKKPEVYTKPDGKRGVRMVPVDKEILKKESVDELSMYTSKKLPNLSYPRKKTKFDKEKDRINMMKKNRQKGESVEEAIKHTHAVVDSAGKVAGMTSNEKDAKDIARRHKGKVIKLKKPMSPKKGDMMINRPFPNKMDKFPTNTSATQGKRMGEEVNELKTSTINSYAKKSKASADRATNSAVATILRKGDHSKDLNTMRKRKKGMELAKSRSIAKLRKEEMSFAVSIDGLPQMFISADSPGMLKQTLRKIVKQPSMIQSVKRVTDATVKKTFRLKAQGRDEEGEE